MNGIGDWYARDESARSGMPDIGDDESVTPSWIDRAEPLYSANSEGSPTPRSAHSPRDWVNGGPGPEQPRSRPKPREPGRGQQQRRRKNPAKKELPTHHKPMKIFYNSHHILAPKWVMEAESEVDEHLPQQVRPAALLQHMRKKGFTDTNLEDVKKYLENRFQPLTLRPVKVPISRGSVDAGRGSEDYKKPPVTPVRPRNKKSTRETSAKNSTQAKKPRRPPRKGKTSSSEYTPYSKPSAPRPTCPSCGVGLDPYSAHCRCS